LGLTDEAPATGRDAGAAKRELRGKVLAARDGLGEAAIARLSAAICARAIELPEMQAARTLMLVASFRSEIQTAPLIDWALERGSRVCLPRILGKRHMEAFLVADPATDLVPGSWGIPEPREDLPLVSPREIDLVLVPGSVFDETGGRCGYGGGFYDNFLPRTRPGVPRVSLALEQQIVPDVPAETHDLTVDVIVTETRVIRPG